MSEREPGDADQEAMHVSRQKHSEAELKRLGINKPDFIDKKVDPFEKSPGRTVPEHIGKRRGGIGDLTLNQLRAIQEAEKAEGVKQVQVQVAKDQVGIEEMPETEGLFTIEDELEDMEEMGFERGGKVDGSGAPPSVSGTGIASAPGGEFTGQDVVRASEEKTAPEGSPRQEQEFPDGYVREDGKIWCPAMKKTSKTGKWFKAHGWVTREYFEKLVRAGKLPLGQEGLVKVEAPVPATGSLYKSDYEQQKYTRMLDVLEGARYLPGSSPLMMQLAEMAVYLYERLQEYQQIKSLMDVPLWVEYRYTQQFLNTVDQIFKMTSSVARAKGMTEVTISAIVKVINDVITDPETKTILVAGLQKIAQA